MCKEQPWGSKSGMERERERDEGEESWQAGWGHASAARAMRWGWDGECQQTWREEERSNNTACRSPPICSVLFHQPKSVRTCSQRPHGGTGRRHTHLNFHLTFWRFGTPSNWWTRKTMTLVKSTWIAVCNPFYSNMTYFCIFFIWTAMLQRNVYAKTNNKIENQWELLPVKTLESIRDDICALQRPL